MTAYEAIFKCEHLELFLMPLRKKRCLPLLYYLVYCGGLECSTENEWQYPSILIEKFR